jgi:hypothetical protein
MSRVGRLLSRWMLIIEVPILAGHNLGLQNKAVEVENNKMRRILAKLQARDQDERGPRWPSEVNEGDGVPHHLSFARMWISVDKQLFCFLQPPETPAHSLYFFIVALSLFVSLTGTEIPGMQPWTGGSSLFCALRPLTRPAVRSFTTTSVLQRSKKSRKPDPQHGHPVAVGKSHKVCSLPSHTIAQF